MNDKDIWRKIFEHLGMDVGSSSGENLEFEYRKAYFKHNFDYLWHNEMQKIEVEHHAIMGAIIEYGKNK